VAHKHDPKLADSFVEQIAKQQPESRKERGAFDDRTARSEQLLWLAQQALETNPQLAFNLAQRSLTDGLSFTLQNLMTGLRKKDVALSNQLFDLALARFSSGATDPSEAEVLAGYLFRPGMSFSTNAAGSVIMVMNPMLRNEPPVFKLSQTVPGDFSWLLIKISSPGLCRSRRMKNGNTHRRFGCSGNRNLSRYDSVTPEFSVPLRSYLTQLESKLFPAGRGDPFANNRKKDEPRPSEKELYESRIADSRSVPKRLPTPKTRNLAYVEAALAPDAEDYLRAKSIAEKISDETLKVDAVSFVLTEQRWP
jgi:hypothetical protein